MEPTKTKPVKTKGAAPAIEEIADLRGKGVSLAQIARMRGVSRQAIAQTIKRHGIAPEDVETFKKGKSALLHAKQKILLDHITPERVRTMAVRDATVSFGIIYDKTRLQDDKSTANLAAQFTEINLNCVSLPYPLTEPEGSEEKDITPEAEGGNDGT